jgi:hypothetical protein
MAVPGNGTLAEERIRGGRGGSTGRAAGRPPKRRALRATLLDLGAEEWVEHLPRDLAPVLV